MSEMKDFVIEDGVLIEYKGQDDNIIIPDGVTVIGSGAFKNRAIKGITIPESVITIEDIAFIGCWFDKKIKIPHSVTSIGCRNFNDYDLAAPPANAIVCNVDNHVLECCRGGGKELIVSADVEAIDLYDCYCKNVEKIIIGNNVQDIAAGTLSKFNNLREIIVKELSAPVLEQNRNLSPFDRIGMGHVAHYSSPYATIDGVLYNSSMTKLICVPPKYPNEYTIPQNVTSISKYAFCGCEQLSKIIIPDDVAYLGDNRRGHQMYSSGMNNYLRFAEGQDFSKLSQQLTLLDRPMPAPKEACVVHDTWKRSAIIRDQVLIAAEYQCEISPSHKTFIQNKTNHQYAEGHHIIALSNQRSIPRSLDIYANIICLCPLCHRFLHYGNRHDKMPVVGLLYSKRADRLAQSGIRLSQREFENMVL